MLEGQADVVEALEEAVADGVGPLAGGTVAGHVVEVGGADEVWGSDPAFTDLVTAEEPESTWLRRGCVPLPEALGPDATQEDLGNDDGASVAPDQEGDAETGGGAGS